MSDYVRKSLWLAANFAGKMIRDGEYPGKAIKIAAKYYKETERDIRSVLAKRGAKKRIANRPKQVCKWCGEKARFKIQTPDPKRFKERFYACKNHYKELEELMYDFYITGGAGEWFDTYGTTPYIKELWKKNRKKEKTFLDQLAERKD